MELYYYYERLKSNMYANKTPPKNTGMTMAENSEYMTEQYQEILLGKEEGLDISLYSNPELNWQIGRASCRERV